MRPSPAPGAVVVGAHVNGLGVARALANIGVDVACLSTRPFDIAHVSRAVSDSVSLPEVHDDPDALVEFLRENAARWRGRALFPTSDDSVLALARNHEELSQSYVLTVEPWERMRDVLDKDRMHRLAARAGLNVPTCHGSPDEAARARLSFPLVVKPIHHDRLIDSLGRKAYLIDNPTELETAAAELRAIECPALVFEYVPGDDSDLFIHCLYMDARGEPSVGVTVQKIRQNPPWVGSARVARLVDDPEGIREASIALLRAAEVRGPAYVEFKRDPSSGALRFIEVNCRSALYGSLPAAGGVDLVRSCWQDFACGEAVRNEHTGWRGYWIQLQADVACSVLFGRREGLRLGSFLSPYRAPHVFAVLSAADPAPFVLQSKLALHRLATGAVANVGGRRRA